MAHFSTVTDILATLTETYVVAVDAGRNVFAVSATTNCGAGCSLRSMPQCPVRAGKKGKVIAFS
jgi:hypothetical protein